MKNEEPKALGLFPYFGPGAIGGLQLSAGIAWDALSEHLKGRAPATLFCYAERNGIDTEFAGSQSLVARSKPSAIFTAISRKWDYDLIFIWHLGLLKLLPFFRHPPARIVLMLIGIEAWKPQDWLTRRELRKIDTFLSISDHTWQKFLQVNPSFADNPHKTVLLGVENPLGEHSPQPQRPPVALMLSRLLKSEDYKGHREVIKAWPLLLKSMPDAELWVAGDGDLRRDLEEMVVELRIQDRVRFWGRISEQKKEELINRCHCLVMPSRGEGFGLVYLEAMRVGRPCLVSNLDAGREVVNPPEAGLAVDLDDTVDIAKGLMRLLTDGPEWDAWSKQSRHRYEQNFTASQYQERLISALFK